MKISPLDIRKQVFKKGIRGYDAKGVDAFLSVVADEYERSIHDCEILKERCAMTEAQMSGFDEREKILKRTLYTVQKTSDEQRENAKKEAELIKKEAELHAEKILEATQARALEIEKDILELKSLHQKLVADIENTLAEISRLLDLRRARVTEYEKIKTFQKS